MKLKESEKKDKYLDLAWKLQKKKEKLWKMQGTLIQTVIGALGAVTGGCGNKRTSGNHPNSTIIKISQNIQKSPRDLLRLAITQSLWRNHQIMLV